MRSTRRSSCPQASIGLSTSANTHGKQSAMSLINDKAQAIIDRLGRIDRSHPGIDKGKVEAALTQHMSALNLPSLPVRWVGDAEEGLKVVYTAARSAAESAAE